MADFTFYLYLTMAQFSGGHVGVWGRTHLNGEDAEQNVDKLLVLDQVVNARHRDSFLLVLVQQRVLAGLPAVSPR